jgi:hypothetical protein
MVKISRDEKAAARFHDAVRQLSRLSGRDFEKTIKAEMGAVLTNAQRNTKKASVKSIRDRVRNQAFVQLDLGTGKKLHFLGNKYPAEAWRKIEQHQDRKEKRRLDARGLAARMWAHIADQLRIPIRGVPQYVRSANSSGKDMASVIKTFESGSGSSYRLGFINALTETNFGARAAAAFRGALNARANLFSRAMKLKAAGQIRSVLDRYPGMGRVS